MYIYHYCGQRRVFHWQIKKEGVKQEDCRIKWVLLKKMRRIRQHRQTVKSKYLLRKRKEKRLEYGFDIVK